MRLLAIAVLCAGCGGTSGLDDSELHTPTPLAVAGAPGAGGGANATGGMASSGGSGMDPCRRARELSLTDLRGIDSNANGLFEPGELIQIEGMVNNAGAHQPDVVVRVGADDARVAPRAPARGLTGALGADQQRAFGIYFGIPEEIWGGSEVGFSVTAQDGSDSACTTPASAELVLIISSHGGDLDTCAATRQLELSAPYVVDGDGDGRVEPGEDIQIRVRLANPGPLDQFWYPGVRVTPSHPGVSPVGNPDWRYGLAAGDAEVLASSFHVAANVAPATALGFSLSAEALHVRCRKLSSIEYSVLVQ